MTAKKRKYVSIFLALLFGIGFTAVLFFPYPKRVSSEEACYTVQWADGSTTEETFTEAFSHFYGLSEKGDILLRKEELFGTYVSGNEMKEAISMLDGSAFVDTLTMELSCNPLESAALYRTYADRLYFAAGEWYRFDGKSVVAAEAGLADTVCYMVGELPASSLLATGATKLIVGDDARLSYKTLCGTYVHVEGKTRYIVENGAILDTSSGRVLIAGDPLATEMYVPEIAAAAQGALLPCTNLVSLNIPFVGSGPYSAGSRYGEFGHLFTDGDAYTVPSSLKKVTVRGGWIVSFAFYRCPDLEEIDACGVDPSKIESQAFLGLSSLKKLHTPRADVLLSESEKFTTYVAECGCTVYQRKGGSVDEEVL